MWQVFSLAASGASHPSHKPAPSFRRPTPGLHLNFAHLLESDGWVPFCGCRRLPMHRVGVQPRGSRADPVSPARSRCAGLLWTTSGSGSELLLPFLLHIPSWDLLRRRNPDDQNVTKAPL